MSLERTRRVSELDTWEGSTRAANQSITINQTNRQRPCNKTHLQTNMKPKNTGIFFWGEGPRLGLSSCPFALSWIAVSGSYVAVNHRCSSDEALGWFSLRSPCPLTKASVFPPARSEPPVTVFVDPRLPARTITAVVDIGCS